MCPTCRHLAVIDDQSPKTSPIVKSLIENLQIRCKNQLDREDEIKEHERNGTTNGLLQVKYASVESCTWEGTLSEYNSHIESSCPLALVYCIAEGCTSRHMRGYMKSGYCQNSECVVNTAREVLAKKQQSDSSDEVGKSGLNSKKQQSDSSDKVDKSGLNSTGKIAAEKQTEVSFNKFNADENKENNNSGFDGEQKSGLTEKEETPKKVALENQFQKPIQKPQHNSPLTERKQNTSLTTRVFVQSESSKLSKKPVESTRHKGNLQEINAFPTNWALIQDSTVNSVSFTTNLSERAILCAADKPVLKRVDSCASSYIGTIEGSLDTLDTSRVPKSEESAKNSNKIIVAPKETNSRTNGAFLVAAVKILVQKQLNKIQCSSTQVEEMNRAMFVNQHIVGFCCSWVRCKPDALYNFVVYRPKVVQNCQMNRIMCGIPGPKRTDWEGGLYPVLLEWNDTNLPPLCKFPKHFHHANVCPVSGAAMLSTFTVNEWHPEITIPEILFDLQQLLAHANHKDPSLNDKDYQFKTRIQTSMYTPKSLLDTAIEIEGFGDPCAWQIVDGQVLAFGDQADHTVSNYEPEEPEINSGIFALRRKRVMCKDKCSCCVYGQSLWDKKHEMRFLFGTGMFCLP